MSKPFRFALITGRFQNLQLGHIHNIKVASELADEVLVFVGSTQESGTERNPFPIDFRLRMVQNATVLLANVAVVGLPDLTNENDICTEWGDYVLKHAIEFSGQKPDLIIHGDDGRPSDPIHWFSQEAKVGIHFLMMPRNLNSISGTRMRELLMLNAYNTWVEQAPDALHPHYHYMRGHLLTIPYYRDTYKSLNGVESK